jgi:hypothetical protein
VSEADEAAIEEVQGQGPGVLSIRHDSSGSIRAAAQR